MSRKLTTYRRPPLSKSFEKAASEVTTHAECTALLALIDTQKFAGASEKTKRRWREIVQKRWAEIMEAKSA